VGRFHTVTEAARSLALNATEESAIPADMLRFTYRDLRELRVKRIDENVVFSSFGYDTGNPQNDRPH
jgi:hypothetical protein